MCDQSRREKREKERTWRVETHTPTITDKEVERQSQDQTRVVEESEIQAQKDFSEMKSDGPLYGKIHIKYVFVFYLRISQTLAQRSKHCRKLFKK